MWPKATVWVKPYGESGVISGWEGEQRLKANAISGNSRHASGNNRNSGPPFLYMICFVICFVSG